MRKFTTNKRWLLWLPMLGVALWLGLFADKTPNDQVASSKSPLVVVQKVATSVGVSSAISKTDSIPLEKLIDRNKLIGTDETKSPKWRNLFVRSSWTPPAPPVKPSPPVVVPPPVAPAFPFQYVGKNLEDSVWEVYLSRGDQSFLVREGGMLESTYRIDSITPQRLSVTYLPLGQSQSLSIGESQ
jgi:hypothetical protein